MSCFFCIINNRYDGICKMPLIYMVKNLSYYKNLYVQTAYGYLEKIKNGISQLFKTPHNKEIVNDTYISIHSLKSQSMAMGYEKTAYLCNVIESIFKEFKEGKKDAESGLLSLIMNSLEKLSTSVNSIKNENVEIDLSEDTKKLSEAGGIKNNY